MSAIAYIGMPGGSEVLFIFLIILLLFGSKKLPELARSLGKSLGEFKKGKEDLEREINSVKEKVYEEATAPEKKLKEGESKEQKKEKPGTIEEADPAEHNATEENVSTSSESGF